MRFKEKHYRFVKKELLYVFLLFFGLFITNAQKSNWQIDPAHSTIGFSIPYFKVGEIKGIFSDYSGSFVENEGEITAINIVIKTVSIHTNQQKRDEHLRTNDFFGAEHYPEIKFVSSSFTKISDKEYELKGNLTMSGITKEIILKATYKGSYVHPKFKNTRKIFTITGELLREDFKVGTNYPPAKFALGNEVSLVAGIQLIKE
ncbi:YceI family protein [Aquimarina sediminis]|uniref:YceI family protein n=1 Tax=Aquimarina sediminis TaxID=2070536 RepID=UPI0013E8D563|nr:YceI family protein [Aquimarina sediminis]